MKWNERRNKKSWTFFGIYYIKTMETYCVSCKKYNTNENSSVRKTKQNRLMLLSNCDVFGKKKSSFTKNQEIIMLVEHLYRNELDKPCFTHDVEYSDSKNLAKRTI